jgi:hypothetical protein
MSAENDLFGGLKRPTVIARKQFTGRATNRGTLLSFAAEWASAGFTSLKNRGVQATGFSKRFTEAKR